MNFTKKYKENTKNFQNNFHDIILFEETLRKLNLNFGEIVRKKKLLGNFNEIEK